MEALVVAASRPRDRNSQAVLMGATVKTSVNETSPDPRKLGCALEGGPTRGMEWGGAVDDGMK